MRHTRTLLTLLGIAGVVAGWAALGRTIEEPSADDPVEAGTWA